MSEKKELLSEKAGGGESAAKAKDGETVGEDSDGKFSGEAGSGGIVVEARPEKTLLEALAEQEIFMDGGCSGKGRCGRCKVKYLTGAPLPSAAERRFFSAQELREGMRLACLHRADRACRVELAFVRPAAVEILAETSGLCEGGLEERPGQSAEISAKRPRMRSDARAEAYGQVQAGTEPGEAPVQRCGAEAGSAWCIAVDLGTTTIAMQARSMADGRVLGVWKAMNPQRRFGSDVISRMQEALEGNAEALKGCAERVLENGIRQLTRQVRQARQQTPGGIYLAGNTVMEHLLAGLCVKSLSRHPFTPVTLEEQRIRIGEWEVTLLPGLSAFVGADVLAGALTCGMHRREEVSLLIDLGTNGELVLGNRDRLLCTATAAGPAFEGGNAAPGTDVVAVIAELLEAGIVDETGLMAEPWFETGIRWMPGEGRQPEGGQEPGSGQEPEGGQEPESRQEPEGDQQPGSGQEPEGGREPGNGQEPKSGRQPDKDQQPERPAVLMTQEQVRAVQMAKAAIHAGIRVLAREYGINLSEIEHVWLAGGFGYFLDVEKAARIGLFPRELAGRAAAVGNTSLEGAFLYGRNGGRQEAAQIRKICRSINLAGHPDFEEIYLGQLNLDS